MRPSKAAISSNASGIFAWTRIPSPDVLVFNRTVALKDTWAKVEKRRIEQKINAYRI